MNYFYKRPYKFNINNIIKAENFRNSIIQLYSIIKFIF